MIADPDVNNDDISKRYTHDTIRPISFYKGEKKGESLLSSTPVVILSTILGRTPTIEEYKQAVDGIVLTKYVPPVK